jgi:C_GCAxxG_C_C family probable redox protein
MPGKGDVAIDLMAAEANCAQAVLCAFSVESGLGREKAMKLASGFGAGLGRRQEVCGAVTGAAMVIGLKHGQAHEGDKEAKERTYRLVRGLMVRFATEFGSCFCRELLPGCDLATEAGQAKYKEDGLAEKVCRPCVRGAVNILEEILRESAQSLPPRARGEEKK